MVKHFCCLFFLLSNFYKVSMAQEARSIDSVLVHRISLDHAMGGKMNDILSDVEYTILSSDKNTILGPVQTLLVHDEKVFLADSEQVVAYDLHGKLLWKQDFKAIYKKEIYQVRLLPEKQYLLIYLTNLKLIQLGLDGKVIQEGKLRYALLDSIHNNGVSWKLYHPSIKHPIALEKYIGEDIVQHYYKHISDANNDYGPNYAYNKVIFGPYSNGSYLLHYNFWKDILEITKDNQLVRHQFLFPQRNTFEFAQSSFEGPQSHTDFINTNRQYIFTFYNMVVYKGFVIFHPIMAKDYTRYYAYHLRTKKLLNLTQLQPDERNRMLPVLSRMVLPLCADSGGEYLYTLVYPMTFGFGTENYDMKDPQIKQMVNSKNPVLVRFKIKI